MLDVVDIDSLPAARHVCWIVDDDSCYTQSAARMLAEGERRGQKKIVFGPTASPAFTELRSTQLAADPYTEFLHHRPLEPEPLFAAFREQARLARKQHYDGLCVVADMDWLLPARASADTIIGLELGLDRLIYELRLTVVCAYRRASFTEDAMLGTLCVHPLHLSETLSAPFTLTAGEDGWQLSGEVDTDSLPQFAAAFAATLERPCVIDAADLEFIDIPGMRTLAALARSSDQPVQLRRARPALARHWQLAGFDRLAPNVQFIL